tara:strand:- start:423 stop:1109 length:687 start_codon:yes stop_codon:yes gene_type:complete
MKKFLDIAYSTKKKTITKIYPEKLVSYLIKNFELNNNSKILEPGFGRGEFLKQFEINGFKTFGMDYTTFTGDKKFENAAQVKLHDAEKIPYPYDDNFFDIIYSKSFIEHFYYTDKILEELYRILKPGGRIITLTPSWKHMYKIFYDSCTHRTAFTYKSINDIHLMSGFVNVKTQYFKQIPILWNKNYLLNLSSEITRIIAPDFLSSKLKWVRFSKEVMLLTYGKKPLN